MKPCAPARPTSTATYAGCDELISMKSASGRPEYLRDIAALEAASDHCEPVRPAG